jgi:hypothetical protein
LEALTQRLLLLARDQPLRARLGRVGQEFVRNRFSAQAMVEDLYNLYLGLTSQTVPHRA